MFDAISEMIKKTIKVQVNRNTAEAVLSKINFDIELEESKPFLKNLFDNISNILTSEVVIADVIHFEYRERYVFEKGNSTCTIDFEYNDQGFFGRVLPLEKQCNDQTLVSELKLIIENLKTNSYAF